MIMKIFLIFMFFLLHISFASSFCIFDAKGNCVTTIQSQEAYKNFQKTNNQTKYYIAFSKSQEKREKQTYNKFSYRKAKGKKRWYEVDWNQGVKLCPEQNFNSGNGVWVVNGSAHIDSLNCVYVDGSPYTRSILVLFARNLNDLTEADSNWILVNQTIVELAGKSFPIWNKYYGDDSDKNKIRNVTFQHDLIVDKTELRIKDAIWLRENEYILQDKFPNRGKFMSFRDFFKRDFSKDFYPFQDSTNNLNFPVKSNELYIAIRSLLDYLTPVNSVFNSKTSNTFIKNEKKGGWEIFENNTSIFWDTTANGYRYPLRDEWFVLQNGTASTIFIWGNKLNEKELSRYMNINCSNGKTGVYSVKSFEPNSLGLYDVYGNAEEIVMSIKDNVYSDGLACKGYENFTSLHPSCYHIKQYVCIEKGKPYSKDASLVKGLSGMRLVRKLE